MTQDSLPLRGREAELAVIERRLQKVSAGTGGAIVIEGSAGAGKTKLVDASMELASDLGFCVGRGSVDAAGPTELEPLFDALFEGPTPLADRRALGDSHASPEFLFWLIQDLESVIEEAALESPILICLDDLHWAGATCAVAIRQLGPRLASLPVAWLLAFRLNQGVAPVREAKSELIDRGAQPSVRLALSLLALFILPSSGTICCTARSRIAAMRSSQLGSTLVGTRLAASPMFARSTWAISLMLMNLPATARKRWPLAAGLIMARRCKSATSRTSTAPKQRRGTPGKSPSIRRRKR